MAIVQAPRSGQNVIQYLTTNVNKLGKKLPTFTVRNDKVGTGTIQTQDGTLIHKKDIRLYPNVNLRIQNNILFNAGFLMAADPGLIIAAAGGTPSAEDIERIQQMVNNYTKLGYAPENLPKTINVSILPTQPHFNIGSNYISGTYYEDGEIIVGDITARPGFKPLKLFWTGPDLSNIGPAGPMGFPNYNKLSTAYQAPSGQGISFLLPVLSGRTYHVYTDGGPVIAKWAPIVEDGRDGGDITVGTPTTNAEFFTPNVNGYLKVTTFDDGTHNGACVRLYQNQDDWAHAYPIYKFRNASSGTLSTVYHLLSAGPNIQLIKNESTGITTISAAASGTPGPGPGGGGVPWPEYSNLAGSGNLVDTQCWYQATEGGWLRISCKGGSVDGCNSLYVADSYGDTTNHIGCGIGINTWMFPIEASKYFYIEFPQSTTRCWYDAACSPNKHTEEDYNDPDIAVLQQYYSDMIPNYNTAKSNADQAQYDWDNYPTNHDPLETYEQWRDNAQAALEANGDILALMVPINDALQQKGNYAGVKYIDEGVRMVSKTRNEAQRALDYYTLRYNELYPPSN